MLYFNNLLAIFAKLFYNYILTIKEIMNNEIEEIKDILDLTDPDDEEAINMALWQIVDIVGADMGSKV